jgi:hypothetical protein
MLRLLSLPLLSLLIGCATPIAPLPSAVEANNLADCRDPAQPISHRKRIAVTTFAHPDPARSSRSNGLESRLPAALIETMARSDLYRVEDGRQFALIHEAINLLGQPNPLHTQIAHIGDRLDVQLVITGEFRAAAAAPRRPWWDPVTPEEITVQFNLHDGFSGLTLARHSQRLTLREGDMAAEINALARQAADAIDGLATCLPLALRIDRVTGDEVTLRGGTLSGLRPGDRYHLYRRHRDGTPGEQIDAGEGEVVRVWPGAALLRRLPPAHEPLYTGDIARSW